ncbi:ferrochelatase [Sandaracinobacter neustonicus]|uniref:Ferrochelatase n=1 Tax=Sandaracinobacter neustonicus TaxID=1715348 RepID=A0A501XHN9_9SPHN|nr:ferrochelatase [Sandaracinobacter neustonicus]TPE60158.1 ferrochelatase [Sandaracinobacter neustonicus]
MASGRTGLLLINLGSPDAPTEEAVRRYLDEFLSDRRVVEIPPLIWQPILKLFVLRTRPKISAANYAKIWDRQANESPLKVITRAQAAALEGAFGADVVVDWAMRYGTPSIGERLERLRAAGCERIFAAPLYPQYAGATTGTVEDELARELGRQGWKPALHVLPPYYDHPAYIAALKVSLERQLAALDFVPEAVLLSFHGLPKRSVERGDPYERHCRETARLLRLACGRSEAEMPLAYQSRFGRAEWLQPYAEPLLAEMARGGTRRVAVLTPGFAADCIETLEEIAIGARETFRAAGGEEFAALTCLNASDEGVAMLQQLLGEFQDSAIR